MQRLKIIFGYSLVAAVFITAAMLFSFKFLGDGDLDYDQAEILGYVTLLLGFLAIYLALKRLRDHHYDGEISFLKAFGNGMLMVGIVSLIYAAVWVIFVKMQGDDFLQAFFEQALKSETSEANREEMRASYDLYKLPAVQFAVAIIEILPVGVLVSLISAFLLNRK